LEHLHVKIALRAGLLAVSEHQEALRVAELKRMPSRHADLL
jgi:hypothetical protein